MNDAPGVTWPQVAMALIVAIPGLLTSLVAAVAAIRAAKRGTESRAMVGCAVEG
jgi:hypothetical protein